MQPNLSQCITLLCSLIKKQKIEQKTFDNETRHLIRKSKGSKERLTVEYRKWRMEIVIRDEWECQLCNRTGGRLHCHHIKSWVKYPDLRYDVKNGITLCIQCHRKIHSKKK